MSEDRILTRREVDWYTAHPDQLPPSWANQVFVVEEDAVDKIRSSWESARGETDAEWSWAETLAVWLMCVAFGALMAVAVADGIGWL